MARYDIHVVPQGDQWAVLREGDDSPISVHRNRAEAERSGRQLASDGAVVFRLHRRDGIDERYDDDPRQG